MSTKATIAHGPNFHLYHEAFEQNVVYLELEKAFFEASPEKVTVAIPVVIWEVIRKQTGIDLSWASKSDEELRQWVENEVDKRIALSQADTPNRAFVRRLGNQTFGLASDTRELQIERGLAYCSERRDIQRSLIAQINELMANQR